MILEEFNKKLVEFHKSKDTERLGVLRYFLSQVKYKEIELRPEGKELTDEIVYKVLKKQLKQRRESLEMYEKANRTESVEKEKREIEILNEFVEMFPADVVANG